MAENPIDRILHDAKLRRTPVRAGVIDVLQTAKAPLAAADILAKLPPHTDAVTVYRTLATFIGKNVVHRVRGVHNVWLFAMGDTKNPSQHRHSHFVCEACGMVECLHDALIPPRFAQSLGVSHGYKIRYSEVILHGRCARCSD